MPPFSPLQQFRVTCLHRARIGVPWAGGRKLRIEAVEPESGRRGAWPKGAWNRIMANHPITANYRNV